MPTETTTKSSLFALILATTAGSCVSCAVAFNVHRQTAYRCGQWTSLEGGGVMRVRRPVVAGIRSSVSLQGNIFRFEERDNMKDLTFQIKGLMAKTSSPEHPNGVGKRILDQTKVEPAKKGGAGFNCLPVNAEPKTPSFNPGNRTSEQPGVDVGQLVVGSGVSLKGSVERCKILKIHGEVEAEIRCDRLVIDEGGTLKGSVVARTAEISGALRGTASVGEQVTIQSTGSFSGKLTYGAIRIELGGLAKGEFDEITPDCEVQVVPEDLNSKSQSTQLQEKVLETEIIDRQISTLRTGGHS